MLDITAPRDTVFAALTTAQGLSGWWTSIVKAEAGIGAMVHFAFAGDFNPDMRVTTLEPPAVVCWERVGGHEPWAQNTFRFELADKGNGTIARFWQDYARAVSDDAYGTYNFNWGYYWKACACSAIPAAANLSRPAQRRHESPGVMTRSSGGSPRSSRTGTISRLRGTRPARRDAN